MSEEYMQDDLVDLESFDLSEVDEKEEEYINSDEFIQDAVEEEVKALKETMEQYEGIDEELFADMFEKQRAVELVMAKNHTKSKIMSWLMNHEAMMTHLNTKIDEKFEGYIEDEEYITERQETIKFTLEFMYQLILRKRIDILTVVGVMRSLGGEAISTINKCIEVLKMGLCLYDPVREQFVVRVNVPDEVREEIDRFGYPLPMIIKPKYLRDNKQTGYLTIKGSLLLKNNHHEKDINLDHLNRVNRIPLRTNIDAYMNTELVWDGMEKPDDIHKMGQYQKKIRNYKKFRKDSNTLINMMNDLCDKFYITHKYDKRGRVYCQGYHFSYQGSDWNKAMLMFANEELVDLN